MVSILTEKFEENNGRLGKIFKDYVRFTMGWSAKRQQDELWANSNTIALIVKHSFPKLQDISFVIFCKVRDKKTQKLHVDVFLFEWFLLLAKFAILEKEGKYLGVADPAVVQKATKLKALAAKKCRNLSTLVPKILRSQQRVRRTPTRLLEPSPSPGTPTFRHREGGRGQLAARKPAWASPGGPVDLGQTGRWCVGRLPYSKSEMSVSVRKSASLNRRRSEPATTTTTTSCTRVTQGHRAKPGSPLHPARLLLRCGASVCDPLRPRCSGPQPLDVFVPGLPCPSGLGHGSRGAGCQQTLHSDQPPATPRPKKKTKKKKKASRENLLPTPPRCALSIQQHPPGKPRDHELSLSRSRPVPDKYLIMNTEVMKRVSRAKTNSKRTQ